MANDDPTTEARAQRAALRRRLIAARAAIDPAQRRAFDAALAAQLQQVPVLRAAATIAVYWPIRGEPDLADLYARWWGDGRVLALPVAGDPGSGLQFCRWDQADALQPDRFGAMTPTRLRPVAPDCLLIPCVGYALHDGRAWRLGYGAGFYDRTLAQRPVPSVGVAYDEAAADGQFAPTALDAPLTVLVTPSRLITSIASP